MKVIIAGDYHFNNDEKLKTYCDKILIRHRRVEVVVNTMPGTCNVADIYARTYGHHIKHFGLEWLSSLDLAIYRMNKEMCEYADGLIAFWDEEDKRTRSLINSAKVRGLKIRICRYKKLE